MLTCDLNDKTIHHLRDVLKKRLQELSKTLPAEKAKNLELIVVRSTFEQGFRDDEIYTQHFQRKGEKLIDRLLELHDETFNKFVVLYQNDTIVPDTEQLLYLIKDCLREGYDPDYWIDIHRKGPHREIAIDRKANGITLCESLVDAILKEQALDDEVRSQIKTDLRLLEQNQQRIRLKFPEDLADEAYESVEREGEEVSREDRIKLLAILCEVMGRTTTHYPLLMQQIDLIQSMYPNDEQSHIELQASKRQGQLAALKAAYLFILTAKRINIWCRRYRSS